MKALRIALVAFLAFSQVETLALANHRQSIRAAYPSLGLPQAPLWIASAANYFNEVGLRVVKRRALERVYTKLWMYERTTGVPFDQLLGPEARVNTNDGGL